MGSARSPTLNAEKKRGMSRKKGMWCPKKVDWWHVFCCHRKTAQNFILPMRFQLGIIDACDAWKVLRKKDRRMRSNSINSNASYSFEVLNYIKWCTIKKWVSGTYQVLSQRRFLAWTQQCYSIHLPWIHVPSRFHERARREADAKEARINIAYKLSACMFFHTWSIQNAWETTYSDHSGSGLGDNNDISQESSVTEMQRLGKGIGTVNLYVKVIFLVFTRFSQ